MNRIFLEIKAPLASTCAENRMSSTMNDTGCPSKVSIVMDEKTGPCTGISKNTHWGSVGKSGTTKFFPTSMARVFASMTSSVSRNIQSLRMDPVSPTKIPSSGIESLKNPRNPTNAASALSPLLIHTSQGAQPFHSCSDSFFFEILILVNLSWVCYWLIDCTSERLAFWDII